MLKRYLYAIVAITILSLGFSCDDDNNPLGLVNFDHAAQSLIDNDSLVKFLESHYYNEANESLDDLVNGSTSLMDDPRLNVMEINENDVDYKLYYFVVREGAPVPAKGNPTVVDSVLVGYKGLVLNSNSNLSFFEERVFPLWLTLDGVIRGWSHGFTNFKGGRDVTQPNGPVEFADGGKGILFIPSGLAYQNEGRGLDIAPNRSLVFFINLFDLIENSNYDNDNIISILEDIDGDGDPRNDDTDGDLFPNYRDSDDDGDGVLTRDEDANGDGDPTNDFSDPDNPTLPDYLNPNIK